VVKCKISVEKKNYYPGAKVSAKFDFENLSSAFDLERVAFGHFVSAYTGQGHFSERYIGKKVQYRQKTKI
jgi:hypothetical protein